MYDVAATAAPLSRIMHHLDDGIGEMEGREPRPMASGRAAASQTRPVRKQFGDDRKPKLRNRRERWFTSYLSDVRVRAWHPDEPRADWLAGVPEDIKLLDDMVDRARRGVTNFEYEHRLLMPDRSVKHLHLIAHSTRDEQGELEYLGAVQDVTQRRLAEEALPTARSEPARVARVTAPGAMTASITHEVNQPLSGIIANANSCLRMLSANPPNVDGARETARRRIRDGHRATEVITRLRGLFAKKEVASEPVDLNQVAREVLMLSTGELQRGRVVVRPELAEGLPGSGPIGFNSSRLFST